MRGLAADKEGSARRARRADNVLSEREITRALGIVSAIARHLGVLGTPADTEALARHLDPKEVLAEIDATRQHHEEVEHRQRPHP